MSFALLGGAKLLQEVIFSEIVLGCHFLGFFNLLTDKAF